MNYIIISLLIGIFGTVTHINFKLHSTAGKSKLPEYKSPPPPPPARNGCYQPKVDNSGIPPRNH